MMFKKIGLWRGLTFVFAILMTISITIAVVLEQFRGQVDTFLNTRSEIVYTEDIDGSLWKTFTPPAEVLNADGSGNAQKLIKRFIQLGRNQGLESATLLKNNSEGLPIAKGSKVTLLGMRSHMMLQGSAFGMPIRGPVITFEEALSGTETNFRDPYNAVTSAADYTNATEYKFTDVGGEGAGYILNPTMTAAYKAVNETKRASGDKYTRTGPRPNNTYKTNDATMAELEEVSPGFRDSFDDFNDAAIVVVGRPTAESNDYKKGEPAGPGADEPLELTTAERDNIKLATDNFDRVVVLVNTSSTMEIEELKTNEKIDSILWIGMPGNYGTLGVADILTGKVAPSGGLPDINVVKNRSHPAVQNIGDYTFDNTTGTDGEIKRNRSNKYTIEPEGIYVGYRYYETRYFDSVYGDAGAKSTAGAVADPTGWKYEKEVSYSFGYGISYTTFKQEIVGNPTVKTTANGIDIEFKIKVTNTGETAGRDTIQIYGQAPYIKGGVEKSAIQLLTFDKTDEIAKGAFKEYTLTADLQNLASWDSNAAHHNVKGNYILDEGKYYFAIGNGAHDALNNVLAKQGKKVIDGMDYEGDATKTFEWNYNYPGTGTVDNTTFAISKAGAVVSNQLEYADWNHFETNAEKQIKHLSRSDWEKTYPIEYADLKAPDNMLDLLSGKYYTIKTDEDTSDIIFGETSSNIEFPDMKGASFDDYRWDELMNKITLLDCMNVVAAGGPQFRSLRSIGFIGSLTYTENSGNGVAKKLSATNTPNAPWTIKESDPDYKYDLEVFASAPNVAASFNPAHNYDVGNTVGLQALMVGLPILWGPGLNTHRQPYNGRTGDYYSEDPVLSGMAAMEFAIGALDYGLIAAPKHFAFNDQETNRNGIAPFMTEQRAREIELRAFQLAFEATKYDIIRGKNVGMLGLMTSFSKIGPVECNASRGLMTGILKEEWGFHGYAVTDISDDFDIFSALPYAGTTCYDVRSGYEAKDFNRYQSMADGVVPSPELYENDRLMLLGFKDCAKQVLWAFAQSNLMNGINRTSRAVWQMTWWRGIYIAMIAVSGALLAAGATMYVLSVIKNKEEK